MGEIFPNCFGLSHVSVLRYPYKIFMTKTASRRIFVYHVGYYGENLERTQTLFANFWYYPFPPQIRLELRWSWPGAATTSPYPKAPGTGGSNQVPSYTHLFHESYILGDSELTANLYCNSRTSVLLRLRDYLRLLMGRRVYWQQSLIKNYIQKDLFSFTLPNIFAWFFFFH